VSSKKNSGQPRPYDLTSYGTSQHLPSPAVSRRSPTTSPSRARASRLPSPGVFPPLGYSHPNSHIPSPAVYPSFLSPFLPCGIPVITLTVAPLRYTRHYSHRGSPAVFPSLLIVPPLGIPILTLIFLPWGIPILTLILSPLRYNHPYSHLSSPAVSRRLPTTTSPSTARASRRAPSASSTTLSMDSCKPMGPSHDIVITNMVWCMAYKLDVGGGVVYCPTAVQWYCTRVGNAGGRGEETDG